MPLETLATYIARLQKGAYDTRGKVASDSGNALSLLSGGGPTGQAGPLLDVNLFSGIDPTGATDSLAGLNAAIASLEPGQSLWFHGSYELSAYPTLPSGEGNAFWSYGQAGAGGASFSGSGAAFGGLVFVFGQAPGQPGYNPTWFATTGVWIDPVNGNDRLAGNVSGAPLKTWAEAVRRWGSDSPLLVDGQSVTVTFVNSQAAGVDPIFFEPRVSGGGQAILVGAAQVFGAAFELGAVTAKTRGAPGQLLTVATMPAGTLKNMLLVNTGKGSQALIDSVSASTATMQQPQTTVSLASTAVVPAPVEDDTWATSDLAQLYTLVTLNLKRWRPVGGDETAASQPCGGWVFTVTIADPSGTGASVYLHGCTSAANVLVNCVVQGRPHISDEGGRGFGCYMIGCSAVGGCVNFSGYCSLQGGGYLGALGSYAGNMILGGDIIIHGASNFYQGALVEMGQSTAAYCDGSFTCYGGNILVLGFAWGSYAVTLNPGGRWVNDTGSTNVLKALLTSGALKLGAATTGSNFTAGTGLWVSGVALTPAAIDAAPGAALVDPLTGAGYCGLN
jgi:hypothetical protein